MKCFEKKNEKKDAFDYLQDLKSSENIFEACQKLKSCFLNFQRMQEMHFKFVELF